MNGDENKLITFEINKHGWVLLFEKFKKLGVGSQVILRAINIKKKNKKVHDESGHRIDEANAKGGAKVKPKYNWDTSKFPDRS